MKRILCSPLLALIGSSLLAVPVHADPDDDHELVRRAFQAGEIVSLSSIIERIERDFEGELLEVELEDESRHGFVYEVKLLTPDGAIVKLLLSGSNGKLLRSAGQEVDRLKHGDRNDDEADED